MNPTLSRPDDVPALRALWKQAFGDGDACLDGFFTGLYRPEDAFVLREGDAVRAMAFALPLTVRDRSRSFACAYLYAVATDEAARGRGCCTRLLEFAAEELMGRGLRGIVLVPGEAGLRRFYRARGYEDYTTVDRFETAAVPVPGRADRVSAETYRAIRERLLAGRCHAVHSAAVLEFQSLLARLLRGGLYRLRSGELEGCACVAAGERGRAVVYELLWPGGRTEGASLAARAVRAERAEVRAPGTGEPFAMARWFAPPPPAPYLGLALD